MFIICCSGEGNPLIDELPTPMNDPVMKDMMDHMMHAGPHAIQVPNRDAPMRVEPAYKRSVCHRMRVFLHHLAARPLFFATILFMLFNCVFLLTFICIRCRIRRARRAAFKRQMEVCWNSYFVYLNLRILFFLCAYFCCRRCPHSSSQPKLRLASWHRNQPTRKKRRPQSFHLKFQLPKRDLETILKKTHTRATFIYTTLSSYLWNTATFCVHPFTTTFPVYVKFYLLPTVISCFVFNSLSLSPYLLTFNPCHIFFEYKKVATSA